MVGAAIAAASVDVHLRIVRRFEKDSFFFVVVHNVGILIVVFCIFWLPFADQRFDLIFDGASEKNEADEKECETSAGKKWLDSYFVTE